MLLRLTEARAFPGGIFFQRSNEILNAGSETNAPTFLLVFSTDEVQHLFSDPSTLIIRKRYQPRYSLHVADSGVREMHDGTKDNRLVVNQTNELLRIRAKSRT
jgi:hypothetical protein